MSTLMKKNLLKLFGAISGAMIIVGVFVPYIQVTGFSQSLMDSYKDESIYLPIMLIIFGLISIVLFLINKKVEFAYTTTGGVLFFIIMQTFQFVQEQTFSTVGVGYYFLLAGSILTAVFAFLTNYNQKKELKEYYDEEEFKYSATREIPEYLNKEKNETEPVSTSETLLEPQISTMPFPEVIPNEELTNEAKPMPSIEEPSPSMDNVSPVQPLVFEEKPVDVFNNIEVPETVQNNDITNLNTAISDIPVEPQTTTVPFPEVIPNEELTNEAKPMPSIEETSSSMDNVAAQPLVFETQPVDVFNNVEEPHETVQNNDTNNLNTVIPDIPVDQQVSTVPFPEVIPNEELTNEAKPMPSIEETSSSMDNVAAQPLAFETQPVDVSNNVEEVHDTVQSNDINNLNTVIPDAPVDQQVSTVPFPEVMGNQMNQNVENVNPSFTNNNIENNLNNTDVFGQPTNRN